MTLLITSTALITLGAILAAWGVTKEHETTSGFGSGILMFLGVCLGMAGFMFLGIDFVWRVYA